MIDFNYTAPELLPFRIQEVLDAPNEPHRIGGVVYVPEGGGECEMETDWDYLHDGIPDAPEDTWAYMCSACGWSFRYDRGIKPKHCPNCGRKAVEHG